MNDRLENRLGRVKTHFKENKKLYIGLGVGVAVGALVASKACQINYKSPGAMNMYFEAPKRNMHPGNVVRDLKTGMVYPSERATARALGMTFSAFKNELRDGTRFEVVGEALA